MHSMKRDLGSTYGLRIRDILEDVNRCNNSKTKYHGKQREGAGRIASLSTDSVEAQIVAYELKGGGSENIVWGAVNANRGEFTLRWSYF